LDRKAIKEMILSQNRQALETAGLAVNTPAPSESEMQEYVHRYVCLKYMLDPEESRGLSMTALADKSIERALELKIPIAKEGETATTCGAAGSSAMKTALLLNALKKDFQVEIEPHKLGFAKDTMEVGTLVYQARLSALEGGDTLDEHGKQNYGG